MEGFTFKEEDQTKALAAVKALMNGNLDTDLKTAYTNSSALFLYEGFDPKRMAVYLHKTAATAGRDFKGDMINCCIILLMRGNALSKIINKTGDAGRAVMMELRTTYAIKDNGKGKNVVTLSRIAACLPWICPSICMLMEDTTVPLAVLNGIVKGNYPKVMMCSTFAGCVPRGNTELAKMLLLLHKVHQHELSMIINRKYAGKNEEERWKELDTYVNAAHSSTVMAEADKTKLMAHWGLTNENGTINPKLKEMYELLKDKMEN